MQEIPNDHGMVSIRDRSLARFKGNVAVFDDFQSLACGSKSEFFATIMLF